MTTKEILTKTVEEAIHYLDNLEDRKAHSPCPSMEADILPIDGLGFSESLSIFKEQYEPFISGTAGPRYFGYVIGGSTPAGLAADWLTSVYDQVSPAAPVTEVHEKQTINMLLDLFGLPTEEFTGTIVSGASVSNLLNMAIARQWYGLELGVDIAKDGMHGMKRINVLSASAHSCSYKALSILGIGRDSLIQVATLPQSECMDIADFEKKLAALNGEPAIVLSSAGTVNTTAFDDFKAIETLKKKYKFWHHVDGAFGGFAACSATYRHLIDGWELADSITVDGHKWLNVPYDSAFQFTKRIDLQQQVFQNGNAAYIKELGDFSLINLTPQASRRWRSLPVWFSLLTYGKSFYEELVDRNCAQAKRMGDFIKNSEDFELLAEVNLNSICFKVADQKNISTKEFLTKLNDTGSVFLSVTQYNGEAAVHGSLCNWNTQDKDIDIVLEEIQKISLDQ